MRSQMSPKTTFIPHTLSG